MTPQEAKLIEELFDRVASLENAPRDADAVRAINEGLKRAPNALYPMVQTVLVQDEALKRADARIRELESDLGIEAAQPAQQPGFLDSVRGALLGKPHGSVPTVRPGAPPTTPWGNTGQQTGYGPQGGYPPQPPMAQQSGGSSFLGTAAATAAGVVGGALLMNSMRGLFGGQQGQAHGAFDPGSSGGGTPWGPSASDSNLAREAGIDSIGRGGGRSADYGETQRAGLFDASPDTSDNDSDVGDSFDAGGDGSSEA